jgi:hypothetical protein
MTVASIAREAQATLWLGDYTNSNGEAESVSCLFEQELHTSFVAAVRTGVPCSLLVLEAGGDCGCFADVLVGVALVEASRGAGAFAIGHNRFALLLPGAELAVALSLARMVELRLAFVSEGRASLSVGAAAVGADTWCPEDLFACADLAMLEAKTLGGTHTVAFGRPASPVSTSSDAGTMRVAADVASLARMGRARADRPTARERLESIIAPELRQRILGGESRTAGAESGPFDTGLDRLVGQGRKQGRIYGIRQATTGGDQTHGVVVVTATKPRRSRIGRLSSEASTSI